MSTSPDFGLPYIAGQQAQPEITHNEAISLLQALLNGVVDRGVDTPPGSPTEGDAYIIGAAPTDEWAGRANCVTVFFGTGWLFIPGDDSDGDPIAMGARQEGMRIWVRDEDAFYVWSGSAWAVPASALTDGDKGDITVSGGGATWTIDPDSVGNTKLANMAEATFKMRAAGAGTGDPIDGTAAQAKTALGIVLADVSDAGTAAALDVIDEDNMASNSDTHVPTQQSVKAYADALIAANDAMVFKGVIDCSTNPNYPAADRGWTYRVSVAGKIGGASGPNVEAGDILLCLTDGTASGDQATVGTAWTIVQVNLDGAVIGPASATDSRVARFDGATGKLIKDGGTDAALVSGAIDGATGKTTPVDADELGLIDSEASNVLKKLTWANLKATLKTYFDGIYQVRSSITTVTGNTTLTSAHHTVLVDATGGAITITLPASASNSEQIYNIKKIDASSNIVTIDGDASETIDGATTQTINLQHTCYTLHCDGAAWFII